MQEISSGVTKTPASTVTAAVKNKAFRSMFRCVECGEYFESNELLKGHFIEKMKDKSVHNCPFCVCTFVLHKNLLQHQAMYHKAAISMKADYNGSTSLEKPNSLFEFNTTDTEEINKKFDGNHESNAICSFEQIRSKSIAKSTLKSITTKPYPFFCKWCSKRFRYKSSLRRHEIFNCKIIRKDLVLRRRNGSRSQVSARTTITRSLSRKEEDLVYVSTKAGMPKPAEHILCHRCNVIFKKLKYLKNHNLRFHKYEKPEKELTSSNTLNSIKEKERRHKGIRKNHKAVLLNKCPEVKCKDRPKQTMLNNKPLGKSINEPYVVVNVPPIHVTKLKEAATEKNSLVPIHTSTSSKLVGRGNCRLENRTLTNDHTAKKKSRLGETITNINNHQSDTSKVLVILNKANDRDIDPKLTKQPVFKPVVCDKCMRSFTSKMGLRKHLRLFCKGHHTVSFKECFMCKQSFDSRGLFYSHLKAFHNVKNLTVQQMEKMIPKNWNSNAASSVMSEAEDKSIEGECLLSIHEEKPLTIRSPPSNIQSRSGSRWTFETLSDEQDTNLIDQHETCSVEVNVHHP
ncbi:hypothetical protein SNE40_018854 [Patella caerulea]